MNWGIGKCYNWRLNNSNGKRSIITLSHYLIITLFFSSCAQVVAPGGGPTDKAPPKVLKYLPDSAKLSFDAKHIEIVFDEYIQLKDLSNHLIISPRMSKQPEITVKSKTLSIVIDKNEQLLPNTTYSINFGNALQDVNENNPYENFRYLFSTGTYIDSLSIKGKVSDAFSQRSEKGILVMLYSSMDDSAAYKGHPDYFTRTNADGTFLISNIRQANYKLVAIKDLNADYKYDEGAEPIAFFKDTVFPALKQNILMEMFQENSKKIQLKKYMHDQYGKIMLIFSQGTDSIGINILNNDRKGVQEFTYFSKDKDTLTYWIKNFEKDTLLLQVNNGSTILDTVEFKMIKKEDALKSKKKPLKLSLTGSPNGNQGFDLGKELSIQFSSPLADFPSSLPIKKDSVKQDFYPHQDGLTTLFFCVWDSTTTVENPEDPSELIHAPTKSAFSAWKENTKYHLFIPPGSITDIFGLTNDSINISFKTKEEKFYGSLKLNLDVYPSERFIVQLLSESGAVVREDNIGGKNQVIEYKYLYPQKYKLRIIDDYNTDSKWSPGNYFKKKPPEKVIYNNETIMIRSNWDAEVDWKVLYIE